MHNHSRVLAAGHCRHGIFGASTVRKYVYACMHAPYRGLITFDHAQNKTRTNMTEITSKQPSKSHAKALASGSPNVNSRLHSCRSTSSAGNAIPRSDCRKVRSKESPCNPAQVLIKMQHKLSMQRSAAPDLILKLGHTEGCNAAARNDLHTRL